jgi:cell division protein ZapA (FtsZ GTPase activity inhibitor)
MNLQSDPNRTSTTFSIHIVGDAYTYVIEKNKSVRNLSRLINTSLRKLSEYEEMIESGALVMSEKNNTNA